MWNMLSHGQSREMASYSARNQMNIHGSVGTLNMYTTADSNSEKQFPYSFGIPNSVLSFCGREEEVNTLDRLFSTSKVAVLHGLGGYGKTQVARHYTQFRREKYCGNIVWVKGETIDSINNSFRAVALDLRIYKCEDRHIKSVIQDVYNYFEGTRVLFIIDNAQDKQSILEYLPSSFMLKDADINVLITSQCTTWGNIPGLPLKELSLEHALQVLSAVIGEDKFREIPKDEWKHLAEVFYCIPLGLQIAAGYVRQRFASSLSNDFSLERYIARIQEKNLLLDNKLPVDSDSTYKKSIYSSLYFTLEKIESSDSEESKWALNLINVCAYLNPDDITVECLLNLRNTEGSVDILEETLGVLDQYSLIVGKEKKRNGRIIIRIHRLVQMFFRYHQEKSRIVLPFYKNALHAVSCTSTSIFYEQCVHVLKYIKCLKTLLESLTVQEAKAMIEDQRLLHIASKAALPDVMRLLLQHGADVNSIGSALGLEGSPLSLLAQNSFWAKNLAMSRIENSIRVLLEYNADNAEHQDYMSRNLLHYAARWRRPSLIEHILDTYKIDVNGHSFNYITPLHSVSMEYISDEAEMTRAKECIQILISRNADVNARDRVGRSVLHYTAMYGIWPLTEFLIDQFGMDSNICCSYRNTPLLVTCCKTIRSEDHVYRIKRTIETLATRGAHMNFQNKFGNSILHVVARSECTSLVEYLIDNYSLDVNIRNHEGRTPLHLLAKDETEMEKKSIEIARALIKKGAHTNVTDQKGVPVLSLASSAHNLLLIAYLIEEHHVDINQQDCEGNTPLFWTMRRIINGNIDMERMKTTIKLLISKNADPHIKDHKGRTLLHNCALELCSELMEFFIDHYSLDPDEQDNNGFTVLHTIADLKIYIEFAKKKAIKCIEVLRNRGARVDLVNNNGLSPAQVAEHLHLEFIPFLK